MAGLSVVPRLHLSSRTALCGRTLRQHGANDRVGPDAPVPGNEQSSACSASGHGFGRID